jgi:hypothetical protein
LLCLFLSFSSILSEVDLTLQVLDARHQVMRRKKKLSKFQKSCFPISHFVMKKKMNSKSFCFKFENRQ